MKDKKSLISSVSDCIRVIKGALPPIKMEFIGPDPSQRRYMDERESASWIGFHVNQYVLGDKKNKKLVAANNDL